MYLPKISIVTTNYNGGEWLERTILSVLGQGYPNLEYVVIDAGSNDNSVDIIRKYESQLHYWTSEPDNGMYDAIQKGFEKTSGDIMAWINSDDTYHRNAFFRIVEIFSDYPQINWLTGIPTGIDEHDNVFIPRFEEFPMWSKMRFYAGDYKWIQQESTFWRRKLWEDAGGTIDRKLKFAGDFNLWLRFFKYEKIYVAPILIGAFRMRRTGQKSVDNLVDYLTEVRMCYRKAAPFGFLLIPFNICDRILISVPIVNKIYYLIGIRKFFGYPERLAFDPKRQKIVLK